MELNIVSFNSYLSPLQKSTKESNLKLESNSKSISKIGVQLQSPILQFECKSFQRNSGYVGKTDKEEYWNTEAYRIKVNS